MFDSPEVYMTRSVTCTWREYCFHMYVSKYCWRVSHTSLVLFSLFLSWILIQLLVFYTSTLTRLISYYSRLTSPYLTVRYRDFQARQARQGGVGGNEMKITVRNLRIREDTPKYLRNLALDRCVIPVMAKAFFSLFNIIECSLNYAMYDTSWYYHTASEISRTLWIQSHFYFYFCYHLYSAVIISSLFWIIGSFLPPTSTLSGYTFNFTPITTSISISIPVLHPFFTQANTRTHNHKFLSTHPRPSSLLTTFSPPFQPSLPLSTLFTRDSAHYDPKARSMRANPFPNENPEDLAFAGDNFIRHTGR